MRRSTIGLLLAVGLLLASLTAEAQPRATIPRIGILTPASEPEFEDHTHIQVRFLI